MREPVEFRRVGPQTPLELQLRRVETRAAFLYHELHKLEDMDRERPMTHDEIQSLVDRLGPVDIVLGRILRSHGLAPFDVP